MSAAIAILVGIIVGTLYKKFAPKSGKWGINKDISNTICTVCGAKPPIFRFPKNKVELWGGWTCKKCGTLLDKYGVQK